MKKWIGAVLVAVSLAGLAIVTQPRNGDLLCALCSIYTPDDALYWIYGCFVCPADAQPAQAK